LRGRDHRISRRIVSKNDTTTAAEVIAELNIHFEDPVSTKTARREIHKSTIHGRAAIAKPLVTESNAHLHKRWCHDHKTWTSDK
jgi:type IV secretory pathway VirD2 relaxase